MSSSHRPDWGNLQERLNKNSVLHPSGCRLWTASKDLKGYGYFASRRAHIWSYLCKARTSSDLPDGMVVRHSCHNPSCVNQDHLSIGTPTDNAQDTIKAGRSCLGEDHPKRKISLEQARQIKFDREGTQAERAARHNTSKYIVDSIDRGIAWNWVGHSLDADDRTIQSRQRKPQHEIQPMNSEMCRKARLWLRGKYIKTDDGHWICSHGRSTFEYSLVDFNGTSWPTHRLSYTAYTEEPIPANTYCRHKCKEKKCISPEHLELSSSPTAPCSAIVNNKELQQRIVGLDAQDDDFVASQTTQLLAKEMLDNMVSKVSDAEGEHWYIPGHKRGVVGFQGGMWRISRLSWFAYHGVEPSNDLFCTHKCNYHLCCAPTHLVLENTATKVGSLPANAVITADIAQAIFAERGKITAVDLAKTYGISASAVKAIFQGRNWSRATGHYHGKDEGRPTKRTKTTKTE